MSGEVKKKRGVKRSKEQLLFELEHRSQKLRERIARESSPATDKILRAFGLLAEVYMGTPSGQSRDAFVSRHVSEAMAVLHELRDDPEHGLLVEPYYRSPVTAPIVPATGLPEGEL